MSTIYKRCKFTIAWLGVAARDTAKDFIGEPNYRDAMRMMWNEYFTRTWIVQELLLPHEVRVLSGDLWIQWDVLSKNGSRLPAATEYRVSPAKRLMLGRRRYPTSLEEALVDYVGMDLPESTRQRLWFNWPPRKGTMPRGGLQQNIGRSFPGCDQYHLEAAADTLEADPSRRSIVVNTRWNQQNRCASIRGILKAQIYGIRSSHRTRGARHRSGWKISSGIGAIRHAWRSTTRFRDLEPKRLESWLAGCTRIKASDVIGTAFWYPPMAWMRRHASRE